MKKHAVLVSIGILICLLFFPDRGYAERPSPSDLSRSAIEAHVRSTDEKEFRQRIQDAHSKLQEKASADAQREASATVVFKEGCTRDELDAVARDLHFDVARAELKVPVGEDGHVFTISIGPSDLEMREGSLRDRLGRAIAAQRAEFYNLSKVTEGAESGRYKELAFSTSMLVYKVEIIGRMHSLISLLEDPRVAVVFPDETDDKIRSYRDIRDQFAEARKKAAQ